MAGRGNLGKEGIAGHYIGHFLRCRQKHVEYTEWLSRTDRIAGLRRPAEKCFLCDNVTIL